MPTLIRSGIFLGGLFLFGLALIVAYRMVTGSISLAGLLSGKDAEDWGSFSPARLQMLIFTLVIAVRYLCMVVTSPTHDSLPALPRGVVAALGGSHAFYLGGKAFTHYLQPILKKLR